MDEVGKVVLGVIGEDVHTVGIKILEMALKDAGFQVVSLGAQVSQEEFIDAASQTGADAILVSSFSGHAEMLVEGFRERCKRAGLKDVILYIGGYLTLEGRPWEEVEGRFKELGFDRVYPPGTKPEKALEDLRQDIQSRRRAHGKE
jgi:methylaspartate mutase sigma subunit